MNVQGVEVWTGIARALLHFFDGIIFWLLKLIMHNNPNKCE